MKIAVFDAHAFERAILSKVNELFDHDIHYFEIRLSSTTASVAKGYGCVCAFANDALDESCLRILKDQGTTLVALRSAGYNNVDIKAASTLGLPVVRVPEYSPYSVAEHAVGLMLALNRKLCRSYNRVRDFNFKLDGLVGFDMHGKTVGVIGTGRIGTAMIKILRGFGCEVIAYDLMPNLQLTLDCGFRYVQLDELLERSRIITLHVPLTEISRHMIDEKALAKMRKDVMLINTGRGALIDSKALLSALKNGRIGYAGLDVYEEEAGVFFEDHSQEALKDDVLARLLTFPNVFVTSHQGFLTQEALENIARTTLENVTEFEREGLIRNRAR